MESLGTANPSLEATAQQLQRSSMITAWQAGKLIKGETTGFLMGGYKLLYKISSGSFGRVYRAEEPGGGRIVAVKILRRRHSEDKQRIDLFNREGKVGLMMNVPKKSLDAVLKVLPALQTPTISSMSDPDWVDVNTILSEETVRNIVPQLREAGARGIVEYPINKIID